MNKLESVKQDAETRARLTRDGALQGALLVEGIQAGSYDAKRLQAVLEAIRARAQRLREGDLTGIEEDLAAQAAWLRALIEHFLSKAQAVGDNANAAAVWYGLALRAASVHLRTEGGAVQLALMLKERGALPNKGGDVD